MRQILAILLLSLPALAQGSLQHIIVIIQENQTFDEYLGQLSGAAGPNTYGPNTACTSSSLVTTGAACGNGGHVISLAHNTTPAATTACIFNSHQESVNAIDGGNMDGFNYSEGCYSYFGPKELPWFYAMAPPQYSTNDNFFSAMSGPSMPNHLIAWAATSNEIIDNPNASSLGVPNSLGGGDQNIWTCQAVDAANVIPTSSPVSYATYPPDPKSMAMNAVSSSSLSEANLYHAGLCGGQCVNPQSGPTGQYCLNDSYCTGPDSCSDDLEAPRTFCQCPGTPGDFPGSGPGNCSNTTSCKSTCQTTITRGGQSTATGNPGNLCPQVTTLGDELLSAGVSWKWYGPELGQQGYQWVAPAYTPSIFNAATSANVVPTSQFYTDIQNGTLPKVVFISPSWAHSEHTKEGTVQDGQAYLQRLVQYCMGYDDATGKFDQKRHDNCYSNAAIFIFYDDFGGFYDHVQPPVIADAQYNNMGIGLRVPNLCIGPYCQPKVIHTLMTPDSITRCIEDTFFSGMYLTHRDKLANSACASDNSGFINLSQTPIPAPPFMPLPATATKSISRYAGPDDVVSGLRWLVQLFPRKGEKIDDRASPALTARSCERGYVLEHTVYHPTGQPVDVCVWHARKDGNILMVGQSEGDNDEEDVSMAK